MNHPGPGDFIAGLLLGGVATFVLGLLFSTWAWEDGRNAVAEAVCGPLYTLDGNRPVCLAPVAAPVTP